MRILLLNGPNLNLLGTREPAIYGTRTMEDYLAELRAVFAAHTLDLQQSNVEGTMIDILQRADGAYDAVVMNAAGFTHTSVAIRDTIAGLRIPVVEVHISNIHAREEFRERSLTAAKCAGCITGFGLDGYRLAIDHLLRLPASGVRG
ncbi:MAG TPA: type II 3-dehydroquinate dehydratase [Flavobacteriales bacterium]|jgi:3-dehydroquinate dehydratase-2|nr:type II 3-dehydroquinate dehydratase [Flavobacteriales bacterium]